VGCFKRADYTLIPKAEISGKKGKVRREKEQVRRGREIGNGEK